MAVESGHPMDFLWRWPEDAGRIAPVPGGAHLQVRAPAGASVQCGENTPWHETRDGTVRLRVPRVHEVTLLPLRIRRDEKDEVAGILALPDSGSVKVPPAARDSHGVCANLTGAAAQARAAFGTIESKYDALLAANLNPAGPDDRRVVFTRARQWLRRGGEVREVTGAAVTGFAALSHPTLEWTFSMMGAEWAVRLTLCEGNAMRLCWHRWQAAEGDWEFILRPDLENRSFHAITQAYLGPEHSFPAAVTPAPDGFSFDLGGGQELRMEAQALFQPAPEWHYMVPLPQEQERGLQSHTDLFSPGEFRWRAGTIELHANVGAAVPVQPHGVPVLPPAGPTVRVCPAVQGPPAHTLTEQMQAALELFLAERDGGLTVIAGFPWFLDWGRDSLIFARGLAAAGRAEEALAVVRRFAEFESGGSIPNLIRGADLANRETSDAPLWLVVALRDLAAARPEVLNEKAGAQTLAEVACGIVSAHITGAQHGVLYDAASGLLWSPAHYTWMDTDRPAGTPRQGYPVEIQALWLAALEFAHSLDPSHGWDMVARRVRASVERLYWRPAERFFADCLHGPAGTSAEEAIPDDHLRPNQLFAITLGLLEPENSKCRAILESCQCLLTPGALRTLAPRPVTHPLPVKWDGAALHDPHAPYHGQYTGPENVSRKPAYHNGTAWTWLYPLWCEAFAIVCPDQIYQGRAMLNASVWLLRCGCAGQLAEITDGDAPHALRGCGAQAWSVSEWLRVHAKLARK